jgi:N-acyl-phosphatidylethanolamine-hydrolysing phospholipase D
MEQRTQEPAPRPNDRTVLSLTMPHRDSKGRFRNPWPGASPHGFLDLLKWMLGRRRARNSARRRAPSASAFRGAFPVAAPAFATPRAADGDVVITWIGHSSFLLQIGSTNILLDPIWSERASPVSFVGPRRIIAPGVDFDALPPIDLVLLSHDHYDHLDLATVRRIAARYPQAEWIAPVGVGAWLRMRGVIVAAELDWWHSTRTHRLDITCTPAQHFSGRRFTNRNSTLWCGWTIRAGERAVFFAGDTARHPEFGTITRRLGPFDASFIPIGAYDPRWFMRPVHMAPDEAVSAYSDIAAANLGRPCIFVAMHWGTFRLTDEPLDKPPALTHAAWSAAARDPTLLWIPARGETLRIHG